MFKRKLTALDYHSQDTFDISDENQFRNLVIWLEDQKIRHYKIEDRQPLRDIKSADWPKAFKRYRNDLACPVQGDKDSENLEWLLSFALLNVTAHPDHLITLKAVSKVVQRRLSAEALENPDSVIVKVFSNSDYVLNQAAKILRLLYIHDLRDLQTKINECIVAVQSVTANPKTDTKLGKVGY
ncbi:unnamed protein product [Timema podura]|uniref:RNA transcription, translation and transport factor protein n=1 Tax=Timema podura TaxID=61482 RepID=A0ABN7P1X1_TIMPD|nr:unnamed protein product [Timema podura]